MENASPTEWEKAIYDEAPEISCMSDQSGFWHENVIGPLIGLDQLPVIDSDNLSIRDDEDITKAVRSVDEGIYKIANKFHTYIFDDNVKSALKCLDKTVKYAAELPKDTLRKITTAYIDVLLKDREELHLKCYRLEEELSRNCPDLNACS